MTPDMAVTLLNLGPRRPRKVFQWSADLTKESSTMREILAVKKVLQSFCA